jgi:hypothetical protein
MTATTNLNSTDLTPDLVKGVKDKLDEVRQLFPFQVGLSAHDRLTNRALGSRSTQFVQQCIQNMQQNPSLMPSFVDAKEVESLYAMYNSLLGIRDSVEQIHRLVGDAMHMAGNLANNHSLDFYCSVQRAAKAKVPGAQSVLDTLKPWFKNNRSSKTETGAGGTDPAK